MFLSLRGVLDSAVHIFLSHAHSRRTADSQYLELLHHWCRQGDPSQTQANKLRIQYADYHPIRLFFSSYYYIGVKSIPFVGLCEDKSSFSPALRTFFRQVKCLDMQDTLIAHRLIIKHAGCQTVCIFLYRTFLKTSYERLRHSFSEKTSRNCRSVRHSQFRNNVLRHEKSTHYNILC